MCFGGSSVSQLPMAPRLFIPFGRMPDMMLYNPVYTSQQRRNPVTVERHRLTDVIDPVRALYQGSSRTVKHQLRNDYGDLTVSLDTATRLANVADAAEAEEKFSMREWLHPCGTPSCAAGWLVKLEPGWDTVKLAHARLSETEGLTTLAATDPDGNIHDFLDGVLEVLGDLPEKEIDVLALFFMWSSCSRSEAVEFMRALSEFCTVSDALDRAEKARAAWAKS